MRGGGTTHEGDDRPADARRITHVVKDPFFYVESIGVRTYCKRITLLFDLFGLLSVRGGRELLHLQEYVCVDVYRVSNNK